MPRNGRPPSMADMAQLVGVSHQTVSRVVNGKGRVSPRTCERVQSAIAQLGYRPNSVARALVTARSGIIGVVTTTSAHFGPSSMLIALETTAREAGFFTSVVALDRFSVEDVASAFDHFSSLAAEAIIVITPMVSLAEAVAAQGASVPVIAVSGGHAFGRGGLGGSRGSAWWCARARGAPSVAGTPGHCLRGGSPGVVRGARAYGRVARGHGRGWLAEARTAHRVVGGELGICRRGSASSRRGFPTPSCARTTRWRSVSCVPSPRPG